MTAPDHSTLRSERLVRLITRQGWLSPGYRRHLATWCCPPRNAEFETDAFGFRFRGRLDNYIDREVYFFGAYEPAVLRLLADLAGERQNPVMIDVGANVGQHTLFAAAHYARVHAFEPYPPLADTLTAQLRRNDIRTATVHAVGLGDIDADAEYAAPADDRAGYGGFDNHDPNLTRHWLPLRRGDRYFATHGIDKVDVIKIDVEGSEFRVVTGLSETLRTQRPAVVCEFWPEAWPSHPASVLPPDYRIWYLQEGGSRWLLLSERPSLKPIAEARSGDTFVALPAEWRVATGLLAKT